MTQPPDTDQDKRLHLLTLSEAGRLVGVSLGTVQAWIAAGKLDAYQMPGSSRLRVMRGDLLGHQRLRRSPDG